MKKVIYFDCYMGISGDMVLGACLDLGVDEVRLKEELKKLHVDGFDLSVKRVVKNGFTGTDVTVISPESGEPVDHVHHHEHTHEDSHMHSHEHTHEDGHMHSHEGGHMHDHGHTHEDGHTHNHEHTHEDGRIHTDDHGHVHSHDHTHRTLKEIRGMIMDSELDAAVKEMAVDIFQVIAEAEAKVHGKPVEEVGFHEVGALDSIVDICGAAICLHLLGVEQVYCSVVREGTGFIMCQHGQLPVPVPAVVNMMPGSGIIVKQTDEIHTELVTPTGFGILKGMKAICGPMPEMTVDGVGLGFGKRETGRLNGLRVILGNIADEKEPLHVNYEGDLHEHGHEDGSVHSHTHVHKNDPAYCHAHAHDSDKTHSQMHSHEDEQDHTHTYTPGGDMHTQGSHAHTQGSHTHTQGSHTNTQGSHTHAHSPEHTIRLRNRLAKAIGHLERVKQMVEDERDCCDVLMQLAAVKSALNNTGKYILKEHMEHCLIEAVENKEFSEIEELNRAIEYFIK